MEIGITGRVLFIGELETSGSFQNRQLVMQYESVNKDGKRFENNVVLKVHGGACAQLDNARIGDMLSVKFNITGKEYNGKWYPSNRCYFIQKA